MALPSGGTPALEPRSIAFPERGLGAARRPRSVNRRQTPRGKKIQKAVAEQQRSRNARDAGVTAPPAVDGRNAGVDPGYGRPPLRPRPTGNGGTTAPAPGSHALGGAVNTNIGAQLSHRVSSGAIGQDQADQVAHDRAILEQAYGPEWRTKVFGNPKGAKGLGWGTSGAKKQMINGLRKSALERAKTKNAE